MKPPLHLIANDMSSIDPIGYSLTFESEEYKQCWTVSLIGNQQALLTDFNSKPIRFPSRDEAEKYCTEKWPDLPMIGQPR